MLANKTIAIILPAYKEAKLIAATINHVPAYVDYIIPVNDGSPDTTWAEITQAARKDKRVAGINLPQNHGVGYAVKQGFQKAFQFQVDYIVVAAGDDQCDLTRIKTFVETCETEHLDVCRGNRFMDPSTLGQMPLTRRLGNWVYSKLMQLVTGYYHSFDFQSSFGAINRMTLAKVPLADFREDYLFDNSLWIGLSRVGARVKDIPLKSNYRSAVSTINYCCFVTASIPYLLKMGWFRFKTIYGF